MDQSYDHLLKILIIGDQAVGKTCLLLSFSEEKFAATHIATIGIDFKVKLLNLNNKVVKLQIWDTAGQERFRNITQTYYKGAMGVILAYDCTSRESYNHVKDWAQQIARHANPEVAKILVANKIDMTQQRKVSEEEGVALAYDLGVPYFETSARTGQNIKSAFTKLAEDIIDKGLCDKIGYTAVVVNRNQDKTKSLCCSS